MYLCIIYIYIYINTLACKKPQIEHKQPGCVIYFAQVLCCRLGTNDTCMFWAVWWERQIRLCRCPGRRAQDLIQGYEKRRSTKS